VDRFVSNEDHNGHRTISLISSIDQQKCSLLWWLSVII